jgi:hypothetical protein
MPATGADIAAATRDVVLAQWSDATIAGRYPSARDGLAQPANGYFDDVNDAQTIINARAALIGTERRRFTVAVSDVVWVDPTTGIPTVALVDSEQAANGNFLVSRISIDLEAETTSFELFG